MRASQLLKYSQRSIIFDIAVAKSYFFETFTLRDGFGHKLGSKVSNYSFRYVYDLFLLEDDVVEIDFNVVDKLLIDLFFVGFRGYLVELRWYWVFSFSSCCLDRELSFSILIDGSSFGAIRCARTS